MNDDDGDRDRTNTRSVASAVSTATYDRFRPPLAVPPGFTAAAFGRDDYGSAASLAPGTPDMYVVPFGLENGGVTVAMPPGYAAPVDPPPTPSIFQSLPSISVMQASKFYAPPHLANKHPTPGVGELKDDRVFQLMTSSSSLLPFPPSLGDAYPQHYETPQTQQPQDMEGYGEMASMMGLERIGGQQPTVVEGTGSSFLPPRCFVASPGQMLPGYAPMQPPPISVYCDSDAHGSTPSYDAVAHQFIHFDVDSAASTAALPSTSFPKPPPPTSATSYSTTHQYNLQHHQLCQLSQQQQPTALQHHYSLPYPAANQPPPPNTKSPAPQRGVVTQEAEPETDEINTRAVAARVAAELKRYSVPQAVFAQLVLCRSQGTLSDLLRNPKPWSKLKSGRETFRRMWKWLQEPEYQRMSALRFAGRLTGEKI